MIIAFLGQQIIRRRWLVVAGWAVAAILLAVLAPSVDPAEHEMLTFLPDDAPSLRAAELLKRHFPDSAGLSQAVVVVARQGQAPAGALTDADRLALEQLAERLRRPLPAELARYLPVRRLAVRSPGDLPRGFLPNPYISPDGSAAIVVVEVPANFVTIRSARVVEHVRRLVAQMSWPEGLKVAVTGSAAFGADYAAASFLANELLDSAPKSAAEYAARAFGDFPQKPESLELVRKAFTAAGLTGRLDDYVLLHVAALQNPRPTQQGKPAVRVCLELGVSVRAGGVVEADRGIGILQRDLPFRDPDAGVTAFPVYLATHGMRDGEILRVLHGVCSFSGKSGGIGGGGSGRRRLGGPGGGGTRERNAAGAARAFRTKRDFLRWHDPDQVQSVGGGATALSARFPGLPKIPCTSLHGGGGRLKRGPRLPAPTARGSPGTRSPRGGSERKRAGRSCGTPAG